MSISIHHPVSPARVALKFAASGFTKSRPTDFPMSGVIGKLTPDGGGADV